MQQTADLSSTLVGTSLQHAVHMVDVLVASLFYCPVPVLCSLDNYKRLFTDAGFEDVVAEDHSAEFEACLKAELERVVSGRGEFVAAFSEADYEEVGDG